MSTAINHELREQVEKFAYSKIDEELIFALQNSHSADLNNLAKLFMLRRQSAVSILQTPCPQSKLIHHFGHINSQIMAYLGLKCTNGNT